MAAEDQQPEYGTPPMPPPRNLRRVGLVAVVAAIVIAVFGILQRRGHEAEVEQWTQQQAIPDRRRHHAAPGRLGPAPDAARHRPGLVRGADLRSRQRLSEELVLRLRRPREKGRPAGRDRRSGPRCATGGGGSQAEFGARGGQSQGSREPVRRDRHISAGGTHPRASSRYRNRRPSKPTTTARSRVSTLRQRKSLPTRARSTGSRRWKNSRGSQRPSTASSPRVKPISAP